MKIIKLNQREKKKYVDIKYLNLPLGLAADSFLTNTKRKFIIDNPVSIYMKL